MPKAAKAKFYAVKVGREGPHIYTSWEEAKSKISRYPGAMHRSFTSRSQAEQWLGIQEPPLQYLPTPPPTQESVTMPSNYSHESDEETIFSFSSSPAPTPSSEPNAIPISIAEPELHLSPEQQYVLNLVKAGQNVFFTGAAGTGKSVLLREIIKWCREKDRKTLAVTASTGIASVNIGGSTLHSWAGIGLGKEPAEDLVGKILGQDKYRRMKEKKSRIDRGLPADAASDSEDEDKKNPPRVVRRWREVQVLIVDEISMIDGALFDKLEFIAQKIRRDTRPFGGIQLVLSGDFCQLPPVGERGTKVAPTFAFDATSWSSCIKKPVMLQKVFRQKEQSFVDILNSMRFGILDPVAIKTFNNLAREVVYDDGLVPTELFPTRREVDTANTNRLNRIKEDTYRYDALDRAGYDEDGNRIPMEKVEKFLNNLVVQRHIALKAGAQVMLVKNLVQGELVNGSIGRVLGFCTTRDAMKEGARIGVPDKDLICDSKGDYSDKLQALISSPRKWPMVDFAGSKVLCVPAQFEVNSAEGRIQAIRDQVPLILAWALSIHKSQGQTLDRVRVDLSRIFEKGQAYVALSRATSIERLQVLNFDPGKVQAHSRVLEWMRCHGHYPPSMTNPSGVVKDEVDEDLEFWGDDL